MIMTTDERPLNQKDPLWNTVLEDFRRNRYAESLPKAIEYEQNVLEGKNDKLQLNVKDRATVYYTLAASAFGILEKSEEWNPALCDHFFGYLDKYVIICKQAADKNNTHGMSPTPPKILLGNALELLCRCNPPDMPEQIQRWVSVFAAIQAPDWRHELALSVLLEKLFNERRNYQHYYDVFILDIDGDIACKFSVSPGDCRVRSPG